MTEEGGTRSTCDVIRDCELALAGSEARSLEKLD